MRSFEWTVGKGPTLRRTMALLALALVIASANAQAQDTSPPTITMDAPVNGVPVETDRVTVTGEAMRPASTRGNLRTKPGRGHYSKPLRASSDAG